MRVRAAAAPARRGTCASALASWWPSCKIYACQLCMPIIQALQQPFSKKYFCLQGLTCQPTHLANRPAVCSKCASTVGELLGLLQLWVQAFDRPFNARVATNAASFELVHWLSWRAASARHRAGGSAGWQLSGHPPDTETVGAFSAGCQSGLCLAHTCGPPCPAERLAKHQACPALEPLFPFLPARAAPWREEGLFSIAPQWRTSRQASQRCLC